jgi:hypothetical protein
MSNESLPLAELLAKAGDGDFLRSVAGAVVQLLMETDVEGVIGARRREGPASEPPSGTVSAIARSTPGWVRCSSESRSSGNAAIFRRSSNRGRRPRRPWSR